MEFVGKSGLLTFHMVQEYFHCECHISENLKGKLSTASVFVTNREFFFFSIERNGERIKIHSK